MSEFKEIKTQEQLEEVLKERLKRERDTVEKKYEGYMSPTDVAEKYKNYLSADDVSEKYKDYLSPEDAGKLRSQLKGYETDSVKTRIAHEIGLSYDAVQFLQGDNEDAIKESAEILKGLVGNHSTAPLADVEHPTGDCKEAAIRNTLKGLKGE